MRIAIIGSGISGLYAAYLLSKQHDVVVFEAAEYAGGHTNTVDAIVADRTIPVDTGFIVYNERNYPLLTALLNELGVKTQEGDMSFSLSCRVTGLEYSGSSLNTLFAQRRNLLRPAFYGMLREIMRLNSLSAELLQAPPEESLANFLARHDLSGPVVDDYLAPMAAAIWSSDPAEILDFPAAYFGHFFQNHGLLSVNDRPQWRTICGGSRSYIAPLTRSFSDSVRLNTPVNRVERRADGVGVQAGDQPEEHFDSVVFACHSDQALAMLADPTPAEREILGAIPFRANDTVLHTDTRLLPNARRAWAAWNYHRFDTNVREVSVTYHMSLLQRLDSPKPLLVSLNATDRINPNEVIRRISYHHPVYNRVSMRARERWSDISGRSRTYYCGAWWGYGFHEDGLRSAAAVAGQLSGRSVDYSSIVGKSV